MGMMTSQRIEGVEVVDVCTLLRELYGEAFFKIPRPVSYSERCEAIEKWCRENGAWFYQADREDFSRTAAAFQTLRKGLRRVVVEDLS